MTRMAGVTGHLLQADQFEFRVSPKVGLTRAVLNAQARRCRLANSAERTTVPFMQPRGSALDGGALLSIQG